MPLNELAQTVTSQQERSHCLWVEQIQYTVF